MSDNWPFQPDPGNGKYPIGSIPTGGSSGGTTAGAGSSTGAGNAPATGHPFKTPRHKKSRRSAHGVFKKPRTHKARTHKTKVIPTFDHLPISGRGSTWQHKHLVAFTPSVTPHRVFSHQ